MIIISGLSDEDDIASEVGLFDMPDVVPIQQKLAWYEHNILTV